MRRIAIITSETPNSAHAGSMQLLRVFEGYPADHLVVLGPRPPAAARLLKCEYRRLHFPIMRLRNTRLHVPAMTAVMCLPFLRRSPDHVARLLRRFQPEAVFTVMDNFSHYYTAYSFAASRGLPLLTVTMDEPDSFERIHPGFRRQQHSRIRRLYHYAETNLCVSRQMTAHIAKTFLCRTETFQFGPPDGAAPRPVEESRRLRRQDRLVVGYAGSLSYGYGEALERIARSVRDLPVTVRIYSRDRPVWSDLPAVEYAGFHPSEELWPLVQRECDASLLVYGFDYWDSRLYRTHFPTKLSEYAWLGMPMVMVGPEHATGIIWGREHPAAAIVETDPQLASLPGLLACLRQDPAKRTEMAAAAAHAASMEFDPQVVRQRFHTVLNGSQ
jgi:hypothetical protein